MTCRASGALIVGLLAFATVADAAQLIVLPVQDRAGDTLAVEETARTLQQELSEFGTVIDSTVVRDAARRLRMRNADTATVEDLQGLGRELEADWIVSSTIHEAVRDTVPRLTVSIRILSAESGELQWAGFEAASGLDSRKLLGIGTIYELERLVPRLIGRMLTNLPFEGSAGARGRPASEASVQRIGMLAVVPFAGLARLQPSVSAESVTEAVRAEAHRLGLRLLPSNGVHRAMRSSTVSLGEVDVGTRQALRDQLGAQTILTGTVEAYEVGGGVEPNPRVMIAMRLVDADSGRILWSGGAERRGWDRARLLRLGRIYSGGELSKSVAGHLLQQLLRQLDEGKSG